MASAGSEGENERYWTERWMEGLSEREREKSGNGRERRRLGEGEVSSSALCRMTERSASVERRYKAGNSPARAAHRELRGATIRTRRRVSPIGGD